MSALSEKVEAKTVPQTMSGLKSNSIQELFSMYKLQIAQALPKHLTVERVMQLATSFVSRNSAIAECTTESLIGAVMQSSILGFEPIPSLGYCYFIPFNNTKTGKKEVQFIIGYQGYIDLARRSKEIKMINAECVYENDFFDYEMGLEPKLKHRPSIDNRGSLKYVYAVAHFTNGGYAFKVLTMNDIDKAKKRSPGANSKMSPWNNPDDFEAMALKTAIRRLAKYLPKSIEFQKVNVTDETILNVGAFNEGEIDLNKIETSFEIKEEKIIEVQEIKEEKQIEKKESAKPNIEKSVLLTMLRKYAKDYKEITLDLCDEMGIVMNDLPDQDDKFLNTFYNELQAKFKK